MAYDQQWLGIDMFQGLNPRAFQGQIRDEKKNTKLFEMKIIDIGGN